MIDIKKSHDLIIGLDRSDRKADLWLIQTATGQTSSLTLSTSRLVACDDFTVTFTHQDRDTGQTRTLRLVGEEFLRRLLQHVLPTGFQRVRHFDWLSAAANRRRERIHALLDWKPAVEPTAASCGVRECPRCQRMLGSVC